MSILIALFLVQGSSAGATILDFEDLPPISGNPLPPGYAGLNWEPNFFSWVWPMPIPPTNQMGLRCDGRVCSVMFNELVDFRGITISAMPGTPCSLMGYRAGKLNQTAAVEIIYPPELPQHFTPMFTEEVDMVVIECMAPEFVIDDMVYRIEAEPPTPAPEFGNLVIAAMIIFLAPAFGLLYMNRRK